MTNTITSPCARDGGPGLSARLSYQPLQPCTQHRRRPQAVKIMWSADWSQFSLILLVLRTSRGTMWLTDSSYRVVLPWGGMAVLTCTSSQHPQKGNDKRSLRCDCSSRSSWRWSCRLETFYLTAISNFIPSLQDLVTPVSSSSS